LNCLKTVNYGECIKMKSKNLIILSLIATLLLSCAFVSFARADDDTATVLAPPDNVSSPSDNSTTTTSGDEILYTIQDDNSSRTAVDDTQVPGAEDANLLATNTGPSDDNTCLILVIVTVLAVGIGGAVGVVHYRRQVSKVKNE
jgi:hypothetical protein